MEIKTTDEILLSNPFLGDQYVPESGDTKWVRVNDIIQEIIDFGASEKTLFDFYNHINNELSKSYLYEESEVTRCYNKLYPSQSNPKEIACKVCGRYDDNHLQDKMHSQSSPLNSCECKNFIKGSDTTSSDKDNSSKQSISKSEHVVFCLCDECLKNKKVKL